VVVVSVGHEPGPELFPPAGHCDDLACFFLPFGQLDAGPVVGVVPVPVPGAVVVVVVVGLFLPFFLLAAWVVDAVPDDAAGAAADRAGWCAAGWATWLAASAELNPARPAAVARAPAAASRPMRMRDIGTSLFR
jgi:hypothetical protein